MLLTAPGKQTKSCFTSNTFNAALYMYSQHMKMKYVKKKKKGRLFFERNMKMIIKELDDKMLKQPVDKKNVP